MPLLIPCLVVCILAGGILPVHAQWTQVSSPQPASATAIAIFGTALYVGSNGGRVYRTTDNGSYWADVSIHQTNADINAFIEVGGYHFAGTAGDIVNGYGSGVYVSIDNGTAWSAVNAGLSKPYVQALAVTGAYLWAGTTFGGGVFSSTNYGTSWALASVGLTATDVRALAASGTEIFAGTYGGGVFRSTDNGALWSKASDGMTDSNVTGLASCGANLLAVTLSGKLFHSSNHGALWVERRMGLEGTLIRSVAAFGDIAICGTMKSGVFLSTDGGITWTPANAGMRDSDAFAFASTDSVIYAATPAGHIWMRGTNNLLLNSVESRALEMPSVFSLEQNFPNPFQTSTCIEFSLSHSNVVSLKVFNALGHEVATIVSQELREGRHSVQWSAPRGSGVFYVRIQCDGYTQTRSLRMLN